MRSCLGFTEGASHGNIDDTEFLLGISDGNSDGNGTGAPLGGSDGNGTGALLGNAVGNGTCAPLG